MREVAWAMDPTSYGRHVRRVAAGEGNPMVRPRSFPRRRRWRDLSWGWAPMRAQRASRMAAEEPGPSVNIRPSSSRVRPLQVRRHRKTRPRWGTRLSRGGQGTLDGRDPTGHRCRRAVVTHEFTGSRASGNVDRSGRGRRTDRPAAARQPKSFGAVSRHSPPPWRRRCPIALW